MTGEKRRRIKGSDPGGDVDGDFDPDAVSKRTKLTWHDEDDLLGFLDDGFEMERAMKGVSGERRGRVDAEQGGMKSSESVAGSSTGGGDAAMDGEGNTGHETGQWEDIRATASAVLRSLRRNIGSVRGSAPAHFDTTEADDDSETDLLQHLDAAFEMENGIMKSNPVCQEHGGDDVVHGGVAGAVKTSEFQGARSCGADGSGACGSQAVLLDEGDRGGVGLAQDLAEGGIGQGVPHEDPAFGDHAGDKNDGGYNNDDLAVLDRTSELDVRAIASYAMRVEKWRHLVEQTSSRLGGINTADAERVGADEVLRLSRHRERHRQYQRTYHQRLAATKAMDGATRKRSLAPLTEADRGKALERLQQALGPEGLDECVCVSCDRLVRREESIRKEASDWKYMAKMRSSFGEPDPALPALLRQEYTAPAGVSFLLDTLVSPRSFRCYIDNKGHRTAWFSVCNPCNSSIEQGNLPKFSISNGFYIGILPDKHGQGLTLPERFMTQLVSIAAMTRVMRGGRHRCIRSHSIVFDCTPGPPISLFPRSIPEVSTFRVAMVGDFTNEQASKVRKMHEIRGERVRDVFNFYKLNNSLYSTVTPNDDVLNELIEAQRMEQLSIDHIEDEGDGFQTEISGDQENIRDQAGDWHVAHESDESDEVAVVERRIGLSDSSRVLLSQDHDLVTEGTSSETLDREFLAKRSNKLSIDASGDLLAKTFPHLFPYGKGHPGDRRRIPMSFKECVKHYTMLSSRRFAEDELFTIVSFDRISMKNMYTQNGLRCQRFPKMYNQYESIGATELKKALIENEQRQQGRRSNNTPNSTAHKFLKTVEIASAAVWGSNAERSKCRQKAIAYQTRFGMPALFVTLTPNTDNSFAMAHFAGKTAVSSLFDVLAAKIPSKSELREASLEPLEELLKTFRDNYADNAQDVDSLLFTATIWSVKSEDSNLPPPGSVVRISKYSNLGLFRELQCQTTVRLASLVWS